MSIHKESMLLLLIFFFMRAFDDALDLPAMLAVLLIFLAVGQGGHLVMPTHGLGWLSLRALPS